MKGKTMKNLAKPGDHVVIRSNMSGVWMGMLMGSDLENRVVALDEAYRLWRWKTPAGVSVSSVAILGLAEGEGSIVEPPVGVIVCDVIEIIKATKAAHESVVKHHGQG
jgi:hypothetical protein